MRGYKTYKTFLCNSFKNFGFLLITDKFFLCSSSKDSLWKSNKKCEVGADNSDEWWQRNIAQKLQQLYLERTWKFCTVCTMSVREENKTMPIIDRALNYQDLTQCIYKLLEGFRGREMSWWECNCVCVRLKCLSCVNNGSSPWNGILVSLNVYKFGLGFLLPPLVEMAVGG